MEEIQAQEDNPTLKMFFNCINLCHECEAIKNEATGKTEYTGLYADEICFLNLAQTVNSFGYLKERAGNTIQISHQEQISMSDSRT